MKRLVGLFLIIGLVTLGCIAEELTPEQKACAEGGGQWKAFPNTCVDDCGYAHVDVCGDAVTEGCDCGFFMCWNETTKKCALNP